MNAEKKFLDSLIGMNPDENKHDFILHFEPVNYLNNSNVTNFDKYLGKKLF